MPSEAITTGREDVPPPGDWKPAQESAPSVMRQDEPRVARIVGTWGLMFTGLGGLILLLAKANPSWSMRISPFWASLFVEFGLFGLLYHAAVDSDMQLRRAYGAFGAFLLVLGALLPFITFKGETGAFYFYALCCLTLALLFLLAFRRHETDAYLLDLSLRGFGAAGAVMALVAFIGSNIWVNWSIRYGLPLGTLGLAYLWACIYLLGPDTEKGNRAALAVGVAGLLVFLVALGRSIVPRLLFSWGMMKSSPGHYMVPGGLVLMSLGLLYLGSCVLVCSERPFVVLLRREIEAFIFSPIFYFLMLGCTVVAGLQFWLFLRYAITPPDRGPRLFEPVLQPYFLGIVAILFLPLIVAALSMRLVSEEKRSGTLEVLLTAPVNETTVVLSKFLACLLFYMFTFVPWLLLAVVLRYVGKEPFDYNPILSMLIAQLFMASSFLSLGLCFSSLTRNQILAAVFTVAVMLAWLAGVYLAQEELKASDPQSLWLPILRHFSFLDFWADSLKGVLVPRLLLFYASMTVFWLFLSTKVLEARRWT